MFKKKGEWLPWYRQKGFRGKLTEEEKRILDSFRIGDNHPAAKFDELPEEVQDYILELEGDISDKGQSEAGVILMIGVYVAGYIAYRAYTGVAENPALYYLSAAAIFLFALVWSAKVWRRYERDLIRLGPGPSKADEGIQRAWDVSFIVDRKHDRVDDEFDRTDNHGAR